MQSGPALQTHGGARSSRDLTISARQLGCGGAAARQIGGQSTWLLDVGSGAGLQAPWLRSAARSRSLRGSSQKAAFIQQVRDAEAGQPAGLHSRVENLSGPYDVVASRAFAAVRDFVASSSKVLAEEGVWLAMKGKRPDEEIAALPPSVEVFHVEQLRVPGLDAERCIVWMKRASG